MPVPMIEREENNTDTPFGKYREKSSQRIIYTRKTSHLVSEFAYKHVLYKDSFGVAPKGNYLYQASFKGYNMSSPLQFKVGRIQTGNNNLHSVDGVSWFYPWGNRLKTSLDIGRISTIDSKVSGSPSFSEGRLHYSFNDNAFMALKSVHQYDESSGGVMFGYLSDELKVTGEYIGGATDSLHLSMQYIEAQKFDLTSDYRLFRHDTTDSGQMRHYAGIESGQLYFEAGVGRRFWFNGLKEPDAWFYEGTVNWYGEKRDKAHLGYILETTDATGSRTLFAGAERRVSNKTTLSLGVEDTRFEKSGGSVQNLEGRLNRRVHWGYVELAASMITGSSDAAMQKDIRLRAGYEF